LQIVQPQQGKEGALGRRQFVRDGAGGEGARGGRSRTKLDDNDWDKTGTNGLGQRGPAALTLLELVVRLAGVGPATLD